ncbi:MAG: hypothetical protein ABJG41_01380 [Cyclobacteriaceae bacterium]
MNHSLQLTEDTKRQLEQLAGAGYTIESMALYFDVDPIVFSSAAHDPDSDIYYHIKRGKIIGMAKEEMSLMDSLSGKNGHQASKRLGEIRRTRGFEITREDIFGGFEDKDLIHKLEDYISSGSSASLSAEESIYLEALTLFNSLYRKYGRRKTVKFFTKTYQLTYSRASDMMDEALNLFYIDRNVEKKAIRHLYAEELEEAAIVVKQNASTSKDWKIYGDLKMQAAKLRELDKPDVEKLPAELYLKPVRVYSLDPEYVGLPPINRQEIARQIDSLDIPERDKIRISIDASVAPFNITERLNDLEEEARSEE